VCFVLYWRREKNVGIPRFYDTDFLLYSTVLLSGTHLQYFSRAVPATVVSTRFSRHDSGLPLTFVDRFLAFSIIDSPVSLVELAFFRPRQGREYTTGIYSSGAVPATVVSTRFSRHQSGLPLTFVDRFCALCLWMCLSSRRLKYEVRGALHIYRSYLFE
jgi:hypothetical protein